MAGFAGLLTGLAAVPPACGGVPTLVHMRTPALHSIIFRLPAHPRAADAEYALSYSLSLTPDLPGVPFGVTAILTSNTDGSDLSGIPVTATLSPATPGTAGGAACDSVATCSTSSGAGFVGPSACRLALPCLGRFSLRVCAVLPPAVAGATAVGGGSSTEVVTVCGRFEMILGRNASEWQQYAFKLRGMPMPALSLDK